MTPLIAYNSDIRISGLSHELAKHKEMRVDTVSPCYSMFSGDRMLHADFHLQRSFCSLLTHSVVFTIFHVPGRIPLMKPLYDFQTNECQTAND